MNDDDKYDDDKKFAAYVAACCIAGVVAVVLATVVFMPSRARAAAAPFDAQWMEIEGERHLVLAPSGQLKIAMRLRALDAEIARLQQLVDERHKEECNLI